MSSASTDSRVALVTGGSSGIGRAVAEGLAAADFRVFATTRDLRRGGAVGSTEPTGVEMLELDVTSRESADAAVAAVIERAGRIDVLVNNAGYGQYGSVEDVSDADARRQFDANVFGLVMVTRSVLPVMRRQNSGRIVNMSSVAGRVSTPYAGWYAASKHAVEALSDALRLEVAPFGIDVVIVEPGAIKTGFDSTALQELRDVTHLEAYRERAEAFGAAVAGSYRGAPGPEVIAGVVVRAVRARRPKTRYAAPFGTSRAIVLMRRLLGDRTLDRLLATQLRPRNRAGAASPSVRTRREGSAPARPEHDRQVRR